MTALTYEEQLSEVQTAITAILGGAQSYSIADRTVTKANISWLFRERRRLMQLADPSGAPSHEVYYGRPRRFD